jgi:hypothetical protein
VIGKRGSEFLESFCRMVRKEDILNRQYDLLAIKRVHVSCCGWRRGIWRWQVYISLRWEWRLLAMTKTFAYLQDFFRTSLLIPKARHFS